VCVKQQPPLVGSSEHMCQPLLDAVAAHLKSPMLNHTLQRTFGPAVRTLHGPPLRYAITSVFVIGYYVAVFSLENRPNLVSLV